VSGAEVLMDKKKAFLPSAPTMKVIIHDDRKAARKCRPFFP